MIITRTPFRVSFFGGGTDYHTWYQEHGGLVLSTTINHYVYLSCRYLAPFFASHKTRVVWSKIEEVKNHHDIEHPVVRAVLEYLEVERGVEIHYQGDLPARSGIGSSSSFTVGMLNAVYGLKGIPSTKQQLACEAVHIEREILKENVGVQDQISAVFGGFNRIEIKPDGEFSVNPVLISESRLKELQSHLLLFFTGISRNSSTVAKDSIKAIPKKQMELAEMQAMVGQALRVLTGGGSLDDFGHLLHESWQLKRSLTKSVAPAYVGEIYERARKAGAIGGKLLGAGGGGFILFFVKPELRQSVLTALSDLLVVPFAFENQGSQVIFHDQSQFSRESMLRRDFVHLKGYPQDSLAAGLEGNKANTPEAASQGNRPSKLTII